MSDSILNIIINTVKRGGGDKDTVNGIVKLKTQFKELTGINLSTATAFTAVSVAIGTMVKVGKEAIEMNVRLGNETRTVAQHMGENAEAASRMIQMADDALLPYETLETALKNAAKNGIDVSTNSLIEMSDQFVKLKPGVEQDTFLAEKFGKAGAEMYKVMQLGGPVMKQRLANVSESLVMDEKAVQATKEYQEAIDVWKDSIDGASNAIGKTLTPIVGDLALVMGNTIEKMNKADDTWMKWERTLTLLLPLFGSLMVGLRALSENTAKSADEIREQTRELELAAVSAQIFITNAREQYDVLDNGLNPALDSAARKYGSLAFQVEDTTTAVEAAVTDMGDLKTIMAGGFGGEIDNFNTKMGDIRDRTVEIKDKIEILEGKKWLSPDQKTELSDLKQGLIDVRTEAQTLATEHEKAMRLMAMNMIIAKASSDGLTSNEVTNIGNAMVAWGLWDTKTAEVVENLNGINLDDAALEIGTVLDPLQDIFALPDNKEINVHVTTTYSTIGNGGGGGGAEAIPQAAGGDWFVTKPTLFLAGEAGPERATFTPLGNGGSGAMSGGGNTINLYVSGAGSPEAVANVVMQKIRLQLGAG